MKPYAVGFIFARGGSKGVPKKNLRHLLGKPLIAYAIETARSSALIDRVVVSTDDLEIAKVAKTFGADVPFMRPSELAQDDSPEWLAWQHALRMLALEEKSRPVEVFVCIPTTAPLRAVEDVDACIDLLMKTDVDVVITTKPASRNPYFNMICVDTEENARLVIPPEKEVHRRQSAPVVFDMATVAYAARPDFVMRASSLFEGKVKAVLVPEERAVDIDTEFDFQFAEFLLRRRGPNQNSKM
jgi:CMP-N-acetylneuraminic acid synthetase